VDEYWIVLSSSPLFKGSAEIRQALHCHMWRFGRLSALHTWRWHVRQAAGKAIGACIGDLFPSARVCSSTTPLCLSEATASVRLLISEASGGSKRHYATAQDAQRNPDGPHGTAKVEFGHSLRFPHSPLSSSGRRVVPFVVASSSQRPALRICSSVSGCRAQLGPCAYWTICPSINHVSAFHALLPLPRGGHPWTKYTSGSRPSLNLYLV